ncbi:MAG: DNA polymerase III subunit gamma/tau, partial [Chlamydiota bacterium]
MSQYQGLSRAYRPQTFSAVLGQEAIVTTLKNALRQKKTAQAYLFCGTRGTGKTTLA